MEEKWERFLVPYQAEQPSLSNRRIAGMDSTRSPSSGQAILTEMPIQHSAKLSIQTLRSARELENFMALPWKIYERYPFWVPPLKQEVRETLTEKNPFWQHAEKELFLAQMNGELVGRIAAIKDERHNQFHEESCGFFGFFECVNNAEVAKSLLDAAREWLKSKGMRLMRGPASPSMNEECGLLVDGFDDPPAIMMPYNPPYYRDLLEASGLKKSKELYAYFLDSKDPIPERIRFLAERIVKKENVRIRHLRKNDWEQEMRRIGEIYNQAWEKNWGFTPMTSAELEHMASKLKPVLIPEAVHFIEVGGESVAFSIILPDINQVLKKLNGNLGLWGSLKFLYYFRKISRIRLIALGVKKAFRNRGLEILLYKEAWVTARRRGWTSELGWILENNENMNRGMEALNGRLYKRFGIYEQEI